jgi:hypothetical protein
MMLVVNGSWAMLRAARGCISITTYTRVLIRVSSLFYYFLTRSKPDPITFGLKNLDCTRPNPCKIIKY